MDLRGIGIETLRHRKFGLKDEITATTNVNTYIERIYHKSNTNDDFPLNRCQGFVEHAVSYSDRDNASAVELS